MTKLTPGHFFNARMLALPLLAVIVIASLQAHVVTSREGSGEPGACGPVVVVQDPDIRRSFARFHRDQSAAAREICAIYRNHDDLTIR
jgi:hypothetical protein